MRVADAELADTLGRDVHEYFADRAGLHRSVGLGSAMRREAEQWQAVLIADGWGRRHGSRR